ncbi:MAG: DNA-directed RNA polymerase subunit RpoH/Rpb5 C-terminal domain-containing protein [Candidatus Anstonellales archaeon]
MSKEKPAAINPLEHFLTPKMKVLSKGEREEALKKLKASESQLPKMLEKDPAAKALGAKVGDIIEIKRKDPTGSYVYYRIVV